MNDRSGDGSRFSTYCLLLLIGLTGGVLIERAGWMPGSRYGADAPAPPYWEAWRLVRERYVDRKAVDTKIMTEGSIRGMLAYLGDIGHTIYLTAQEFAQQQKNIAGELDGIGARLTVRKGKLTVVQTFPNSPARQAGLLPGDVFQEVAGKNVQASSLQKVVELVRGPPGTTVQLRMLRPGHAEPLKFTVRREKLSVPDVTWHLLPGAPIAHIAILEFGNQADAQLKAALTAAKEQGAKALIVDVRGNPGGLKEQAVAVTSEFLKSGDIFQEQDADGKRVAVAVKEGGIATEIPICVLIDQGTASSAEILAGAVQDHERGKLVGTRTFGTGTILQPFLLSDGSVILLAVREWLTPKGRVIWHQGIEPDIEVTLPEDAAILLPEEENTLTAETLAKSDDRQLLKAYEMLKERLGR